MAISLTLPAGYWTVRGRDGFELRHEHFGCIGDEFSTYADAVFAAQDHADEIADEASAEAAAIAESAYDQTLDTIHAMIAGLVVQHLPGDDAARGEQRAVRVALAAIDALGVGSAAPVAVGKAA